MLSCVVGWGCKCIEQGAQLSVIGSKKAKAFRHPNDGAPVHSFIGVRIFGTVGETIRHNIQPDVVLKESFEARECPSESLSRGGHILDKFVPIACPS